MTTDPLEICDEAYADTETPAPIRNGLLVLHWPAISEELHRLRNENAELTTKNATGREDQLKTKVFNQAYAVTMAWMAGPTPKGYQFQELRLTLRRLTELFSEWDAADD